MPKDIDSFRGICNDLDGWFLSGSIQYQNNESFYFAYQYCESDTIATKMTQSILNILNNEFKDNPVMADYLLETQYRYLNKSFSEKDRVHLVNKCH